MYPALRAEIETRFAAIESFLDATKGLKGDAELTAKGLLFVQAYAVYEYTICSVCAAAIDAIKAHNHRMVDLSPSLLALFLDPELTSLREIGRKGVWDSRLKVFERAFSRDAPNLPAGTKVPHDGSHFRYTQLETIFRVFGINRLPVRRRAHMWRINEVVDHRNEIAHGSDTAENVGRRYSRADVKHVLRQMKSVCQLQVAVFETYCANRARQRR